MNILIVGNGFDLSHYLPTKYDHFMVAMDAIENWEVLNSQMGFDDLFDSLYEKESYFFSYTRAIYKIDDIQISLEQVNQIKKQLKNNVWYRYFYNHFNHIDTWIDFESEFSKALDVIAKFAEQSEKIFTKYEYIESQVFNLKQIDEKVVRLGSQTTEKLRLLGILDTYSQVTEISKKYYRNQNKNLDINFHLIIEDLERGLNDFIELFNKFLHLVIDGLRPQVKLNANILETSIDDFQIYSFNYSKTIKNLYLDKCKINFLHGKVGTDSKLVLGISDLKNEFLRKFKNYSFTKYHQKLLKNTDYLFLRENKELMSLVDSNHLGQVDINIYIWGHSLAESDESYINEIFSFNQKLNLQCFVTVYFHGNDAPKLLNNLLDILKKDKVELWMKKGWLKFVKNPDIAEINSIKPVDLPTK